MCRKMKAMTGYFVVAMFFIAALATTASAVDGVIEINQTKALAGGITPGDDPGFPVTISQPGSYRLTGNLTVTATNISAIVVFFDDVTIDLNGFSITGPTVCSGSPLSCNPQHGGRGVYSPGSNLSVFNGTVRGMQYGIVMGENGRIEKVHATSNSEYGIYGHEGTLVNSNTSYRNGYGIHSQGPTTGNVANYNKFIGINAQSATVSNNTANNNGTIGIVSSGNVVVGNTVIGNGSHGLYSSGPLGYSNNVLINNNGGGTNPQVFGGVQIGTNLCGSTVCP